MPFELFRENRIILNGRVNGNDTPMILDSGAGVTTIDRDFARQIGLKKAFRSARRAPAAFSRPSWCRTSPSRSAI